MDVDLGAWALRYGPARVRRAAMARTAPYDQADHGYAVLRSDAEAEMLTDLWSQGTLPAYCIQQIAASACQVASRPAMERLARIGNHGENTNNSTRDLKKAVAFRSCGFTTSVPSCGTLVSQYCRPASHAGP